MAHERGMWHMFCFNGLSDDQQQRVVEWGNLEWGYVPEGPCENGAEVEVTTIWDLFPGPRYYCVKCAIERLTSLDTAAATVNAAIERLTAPDTDAYPESEGSRA